MIDIQTLRNNLDAVAARLDARGFVLDRQAFVALDAERKGIQMRTQDLEAQRNAQAKKIGQAKSRGEDAAPLMAESAEINTQLAGLGSRLESVQARMHDFLSGLPNPPQACPGLHR